MFYKGDIMADKKTKRETELEQHLGELTADLQRVQADFINYRTRMEEDKQRIITGAKAATIMKLLPVIDNIERAVAHVPAELEDNQWAKGVSSLGKNLEKSLADLGLVRIVAKGQPFDPNLHEAISAEGEGEHEVVSEELRAGYLLDGQVVRHSMVKVQHQDAPAEDQ
jgi:molecular chaperone GrpE